MLHLLLRIFSLQQVRYQNIKFLLLCPIMCVLSIFSSLFLFWCGSAYMVSFDLCMYALHVCVFIYIDLCVY